MGEASQPLNRTKVYLLNDDGQWDDRGTGHAEIQYMPAEDAAFIIVMSEENAETSLLQTKIHMQDIYQRQQDTIISWNEPDTGVDYALSFQNPDGCTELWEQICGLQGRSSDEPPRDGDGGGGSGSPLGGGGGAVSRDDALTLPAPEMRNLAAIADALTDVPLFRRGKLVEALLRGDYLPALVRLFATVEDLESRPDLHHLYNIFKGALLLNDAAIYEVLLRDELVMAVFGALEYDPELADHADHREFLGDHRRFRQARARDRSPGRPAVHPTRLPPCLARPTTTTPPPHRAARRRR